jgi:hypothetical protein
MGLFSAPLFAQDGHSHSTDDGHSHPHEVDANASGRGETTAPRVQDPVGDEAEKPHWHHLEIAELNGKIRSELRRLARTSRDPHHRRRAVLILGRRDPGRATAHICDRLLRLDENPGVKVAAAACLGRQEARVAAPHVPTLVSALSEHRDVIQIASAEALARVGDRASVDAIRTASKHTTGAAAQALLNAAQRGEMRLAQLAEENAQAELTGLGGVRRTIPPAGRLQPGSSFLGPALSGTWLGLYGGSAGWFLGGMTPIVLGQDQLLQTGPFLSIGMGLVGLGAGAAYGALAMPTFRQAHTVAHFGGMGTLFGLGAGFLTAPGGAEGPRMAAGSVIGVLAGSATGLVMAHAATPSPGSLALGTTVAGGAGLSMVALAGSLGFRTTPAVALAALGTGLTGQVATLATAPYEIGLYPVLGATLGGVMVAGIAAFTLGVSAAFIPEEWDPFLNLDVQPELTFAPPPPGPGGGEKVNSMNLVFGLKGSFGGVPQ